MTAPNPERLRELLARAGVESGAPFEAFSGEVLGRDGDCLLGCYFNAAHGYDARSTADLIAATLNALPALLHQLAEERDELASLQVIHNCLRRDHERSKARAEAAERARDEAMGLLRDCDTVANVRGMLGVPDCIDNNGQPYQSAHLAAFLAASGGKVDA